MIGILDLVLRLVIWFLLTADLSLTNIIIGISVALLLPRSATAPRVLKDWLRALWEAVVAIPQAYIAVEIMVRPHAHEAVTMERVKLRRTPGLIFLDIFLITIYAQNHCVEVPRAGLV